MELNSRNVGYGYDNDYRLTSEAITGDPGGNNGTVSYTNYDAVGNRTQMSSTLGAVPSGTFYYDSSDRLSGPSYNNNGNMIGLSGTTIAYDFENRMKTYGAINTIPAQIVLATALACATEEDATGFGAIFGNLLQGDPPLNVYQSSPCVVKRKKSRWTCTGQCQIQNYSGGGGVSFGPTAEGTGSTQTEACQAAKSAAVALTPRGSYPRHCDCYNCTKR